MRELHVNEVRAAVARMVIDANCCIGEGMLTCLEQCRDREEKTLSRNVLDMIVRNDRLAEERMVAMCQDTGMAVFRVQVGQEIHFVGGSLDQAIHDGTAQGYEEGYLRKSVVGEPLFDRVNTRNNTPAVIYYEFVPGDQLHITFAPKGFGSENMSVVKMLKPADGVDGVLNFVVEAVKNAGPNPCPPIVVGVGIGGTFEKAAQLSKFALMRDVGSHNEDPRYAALEDELMERINALAIGPAGLGGKTTALGVHVEWFPTHIAGLPVAVNLCCHAYRHSSVTL
ncbi:MAG: fumarate hydratase [Oscillospiraceae bacterium]|nr:fumarate hydratase [Oscillospiraceae bacterium]